MIALYFLDDEFYITEFVDVEYSHNELLLTPSSNFFKSVAIKDITYIEAKTIISQLFEFGKVDLSKYKVKTYLLED